jgi:hypothetical protein
VTLATRLDLNIRRDHNRLLVLRQLRKRCQRARLDHPGTTGQGAGLQNGSSRATVNPRLRIQDKRLPAGLRAYP